VLVFHSVKPRPSELSRFTVFAFRVTPLNKERRPHSRCALSPSSLLVRIQTSLETATLRKAHFPQITVVAITRHHKVDDVWRKARPSRHARVTRIMRHSDLKLCESVVGENFRNDVSAH
jgi:hypothetical protein